MFSLVDTSQPNSKIQEIKNLLYLKLNEYSEFAHTPNKIIGKFPYELYKRWYDMYNTIYNKEAEKLTEIFHHIYNKLKD